jgi:hypothetical protein
MCADIGIHDKGDGNPHAHILLTMRPIEKDGTFGAKSRMEYILNDSGEKIKLVSGRYKTRKITITDWNDRGNSELWRKNWADTLNKHLEFHGHEIRVDHRSFERQGLEILPTIHLGAVAHGMEKKGIRTERGDINRAIEISNRKLRQIEERINELQGWLAEEIEAYETQKILQSLPQTASPIAEKPPQPTTQIQNSSPPQQQKPQPAESKPPIFADVIRDIISRQTQGKQISVPDNKLFEFLKKHDINDYKGLERHLKKLMEKQQELRQEYNPVCKRSDELAKHIEQHENYKESKADYDQYLKDLGKQLPWNKKSFAESNRWIVENYNIAKNYIDGVRNEKGKIPISAWQKEESELSEKLRVIDGKYKTLETEVDQVNKFRVRLYDILRKEQQREQPTQTKNQNKGR